MTNSEQNGKQRRTVKRAEKNGECNSRAREQNGTRCSDCRNANTLA